MTNKRVQQEKSYILQQLKINPNIQIVLTQSRAERERPADAPRQPTRAPSWIYNIYMHVYNISMQLCLQKKRISTYMLTEILPWISRLITPKTLRTYQAEHADEYDAGFEFTTAEEAVNGGKTKTHLLAKGFWSGIFWEFQQSLKCIHSLLNYSMRSGNKHCDALGAFWDFWPNFWLSWTRPDI